MMYRIISSILVIAVLAGAVFFLDDSHTPAPYTSSPVPSQDDKVLKSLSIN